MSSPQEGLVALQAAGVSGKLGEFCERHGVRVMTVFGSVAQGADQPNDLDIGVMLEPGTPLDALPLVSDLVELTGTDAVDVAYLDAGGPLIRERALVGSIVLYESEPGAWAEAQVAAVLVRMDTDWMRRLDLELMAG